MAVRDVESTPGGYQVKNHKQIMNECRKCKNKRKVPGNAHIKCVDPDPEMTGDEYGINKGWFMYPDLFDPTWKTKLCDNFVKA